ncbi:MAG: DUF3380 domain-containing protein [Proteobacteria bacterium]|nr:DUF3380 domain-containing protein [Pseudomonadota bacterium]
MHEYQVGTGDNLSKISEKFTGNSERWRELFDNGMNSHIANPNVIGVGEVLQIPQSWGGAAPTGQEGVEESPWWANALDKAGDAWDSTKDKASELWGSLWGDDEESASPSGGGSSPSKSGTDDDMGPTNQIPLDGLKGLDKKMALIYNEKGAFLATKAAELSIDQAAAAAVLRVESGGKGFSTNGKMIIRFENHQFYKHWGKSNSEKFNEHFRYSPGKSWTGHQWRPNASGSWQDFHGNQNREWEVLEFARNLDDTGALCSISMGIAQIMGFNYQKEGYADVQSMFEEMGSSLTPQMCGMFEFIKNTPSCIDGLQSNNFVQFAAGYNGSGQASKYGNMIAQAATVYKKVTNGYA